MIWGVRRERLLEVMRRRHELSLLALESPAGFGRSVLIDQALAESATAGSRDDVLHRCDPDDAESGRLASRLLEGLSAGVGPAPRTGSVGVVEDARGIAAAMRSVTSSGSDLAVVIDNVELAGREGGDLIAALARRLPERGHLVVSGRRLPELGLARHMAAGTGVLLDDHDLAFRPDELLGCQEYRRLVHRVDPELLRWPALASLLGQDRDDLVPLYLEENVLDELDPPVAAALGALVVSGGCPREAVADVVGSVLRPDGSTDTDAADRQGPAIDAVVDVLARLPLVPADDGFWPHPVWSQIATAALDARQREAAVVAKVRWLIRAGAVHEAGNQAVTGASGEGLRLAVRAALATQPPRASIADLRSWSSSDVLAPGSIERDWLGVVVSLQVEDPDGEARRRLESVRHAFAARGDEEGEVALLLHLGALARAYSDTDLVLDVLARGAELASNGNPVVNGLLAVGQAVAAQLQGDPDGALEALERVPPDALTGEWASQALMVRGANLLLTGRNKEAIEALHESTGEGTEATRGTAHDLLSTARWFDGDPIGALEDAEVAEWLGRRSGTARTVLPRTRWRACMLAASGRSDEARACVGTSDRVPEVAPDESAALGRLADILILITEGDEAAARSALRSVPVFPRAVRSSVWKLALATAFSDGDAVALENDGYATRQAVAAGRAAAIHRAGGPAAPAVHRPYLPARWCHREGPSIVLRLSGPGGVERDGQLVTHPAWRRSRVRELCLHLALVEDSDRAGVAAALWPDRSDQSAARNLRVTMTYLLDVLDPDRSRSSGSSLIVDTEGSLALRRSSRLRVDLWELQTSARAVADLPDHERPAMLAHARRMLRVGAGPLASGPLVGDWVERYRRDRDRLTETAALRAGRAALVVADHALAEDLGTLALGVNQWSEEAHGLVAEARLCAGDLGGARTSLHHAFETFHDLGVTPGPELARLSHRVGLSGRSTPAEGRNP